MHVRSWQEHAFIFQVEKKNAKNKAFFAAEVKLFTAFNMIQNVLSKMCLFSYDVDIQPKNKNVYGRAMLSFFFFSVKNLKYRLAFNKHGTSTFNSPSLN